MYCCGCNILLWMFIIINIKSTIPTTIMIYKDYFSRKKSNWWNTYAGHCTVLLEAGSEMVWGVFHLKQLEILMLFGGVLDRDQSSKTANKFCRYAKFAT